MSSSVPVTHDTNQLDPTRYPGDAAILREHPELTSPTPEERQSAEAVRQEMEASRDGAALGETIADHLELLVNAETALQANPNDAGARKAEFRAQVEGDAAARHLLTSMAKEGPIKLIEFGNGEMEVSLPTGEVFKGHSLKVVRQLAQAQVNTKRWGQGFKQELETLKAAPPVQQPTNVPDTSQPIDASGITPDHIAKALGFDNGAELLQFGNSLVEMQQERKLTNMATDFYRACPDFPDTPEANDALAMVLERAGLPETAAGMAAAHSLALRAGYYQPLPKEAYEPQSQTNTRPAPPPTPTTGTLPTGNPQNEYTMPIDQLRMQLLKTPFRSEG